MTKYQRMTSTDKGKRLQQRDIAAAAGVSISTVSRVLNNIGGISPDLRVRVLQAAAQLGYQQKEPRLERIHIFIEGGYRNSSFYTDVVSGVETECNRLDIPLSYIFPEEGAGKRAFILKKVKENSSDGLILIAQQHDRELLELLATLNLCVVLLDTEYEGLLMDTFVYDNWAGIRKGMRYLIEHGHRSILHVNNTMTLPTFSRRLAGYRSALEEAGIVYDPRLVLDIPISLEGSYEGMKRFLAAPHPSFTAISCVNDFSAIGTVRALQEMGLRVPQDISIVGYGDDPMAAFMLPPLTTIRFERGELGMLTVQRLLARAANPRLTPVRVEQIARFIERQSVTRINEAYTPYFP